MITKVYLAGASSEIERARFNAQRMRDADIHVMSTWVEVIGKAGSANPAHATPEQLTKWTLRDLEEVKTADVLWLQLPALDKHTVGAWIELGIAYSSNVIVLMSGPHRPIFTPVLAHKHFETDDEAFAWLKEEHNRMVDNRVREHLDLQRSATGGMRLAY